MKRAKRLLCMLLTLCMILGMLPMTVLAAGSLPFTDVKVTDWYYDEVQYVYENGMMKGTGGGKFSPDAAVTRAMVVTILHRLEGEPIVGVYAFEDVNANDYFFNAVAWANGNGIVKGYGGGKFGPNDPITREQLAAILYRYANYAGRDVSARADLSAYKDNGSIGSYAKDAMNWAVAEGLISGMGGKQLNPGGTASRAQVAAILARFADASAAAVLPLPVNPGHGGSSGLFPDKETEYTKEESVERMQYVDEILKNTVYKIDGYDNLTTEEKVFLAKNTLNNLARRGYVVRDSILYSENPAKFTFQYESEIFGVVVLENWYSELDGDAEVESEEANPIALMSMSRAADKDISDCAAVILWAYKQDGLNPFSYYNQSWFYNMAESWEEQGLDTTTVWETTVDSFKTLGSYDVICIAAHGLYIDFSYPYLVGDKIERLQKSVPIYGLTEKVTKEKDGHYYSDLINHNIGKFYDEDGNDTYCILPQFFTAHYGNDGLDGTFIFAQCCQSMGNSENSYSAAMANAFINASAETYIGFYNSVRTQYANNFMETYVDGLIDGKTSQAAFDAAKDKHGKNDWIIKDIVHNRPTAIPYLSGAGETKLWKEADAQVNLNYRYGYFVEDTQNVHVENGPVIENGVIVNPDAVSIYTYYCDIVDFDGKTGNKTPAQDQKITKTTFNAIGTDGNFDAYDYIGTLAQYERNSKGEYHIVSQAEQADDGAYLVRGVSQIHGTKTFTGANTQFMVRTYNWNTGKYQYIVYVGYNNLPTEQFGSQVNYAQTIQYLVGNNGIATHVFIDVK